VERRSCPSHVAHVTDVAHVACHTSPRCPCRTLHVARLHTSPTSRASPTSGSWMLASSRSPCCPGHGHSPCHTDPCHVATSPTRTLATSAKPGTYIKFVNRLGPFTTPHPPLPPLMFQPLPQTVPEDELEQRQAVDSLFTLYELQHLQMMKIKDLLCK
jgi:hypothetical protein